MRYWDTSALAHLFARQPGWQAVREWVAADEAIVTSWLTEIEYWSALARLQRMGALDERGVAEAVNRMGETMDAAHEIGPTSEVRDKAVGLLRIYPLRTGDAVHLASALEWCGGEPEGHEFVTFDRRLAEAARREGFVVLTEEPNAG